MMHTSRIAVRPSSGGRDLASLRRSLKGVAFLVLILLPLLIAPTGAAPRVRTAFTTLCLSLACGYSSRAIHSASPI